MRSTFNFPGSVARTRAPFRDGSRRVRSTRAKRIPETPRSKKKRLPGADEAEERQPEHFPGAEGAQQKAAEEECESATNVSGHGVNAERHGAFGWRERVRDHGICGGGEGGFTDADAHSQQEKLA